MEKKEAIDRLFELEKQIDALKDALQPPKPPTTWEQFKKRLARTSKWLAAHWFLITFLIAISTAVYVRYVYDIAYLEEYRNTATTKKLSEFYRKLGDSMLFRLQFKEAATAYKSALELQKTNQAASEGLAKASIALPPQEGKFLSLEAFDAKLKHMLQEFPKDPVLLLIKSSGEYERNNPNAAIQLAADAIKEKPNFAAAYTQLGFYYQIGGIEHAMRYYQMALDRDPEHSITQTNLGFCRILTGDFGPAITLLDQANTRMPRLVTALLLGDAYRYDQRIEKAIETHEYARQIIEQNKREDLFATEYLQSVWVLNYMPQRKGDMETTNQGVKVYSFEDMAALLNYSLSFDYAVRGDLDMAEQAFARASKDKKHQVVELRTYLGSHISYIQNNMNLPPDAWDWLDEKREALQ